MSAATGDAASPATVTAMIVAIGPDGAGLAHDGTLIGHTLAGERVLAVGEGGRRRLLAVETASAERVAAPCPLAGPQPGACGGCALQHWALAPMLAWKHERVATALAALGIDASVGETIDAHGEGRRRATIHARRGRDGRFVVGFSEARSHVLTSVDRCIALAPALQPAFAIGRTLGAAIAPLDKPLDLVVTAVETGLDVDLRGVGPLPPALSERVVEAAMAFPIARLTNHGALLVQREPPTLSMGRARIVLSPGGFIQATAAGETILSRLVMEAAGAGRRAADLFCGVGPFAFRLAERMSVIAIDADRAGIASLIEGARKTSGLKPISAAVRNLFKTPMMAHELRDVDVVVINPPRAGAEGQARALAASAAPRIVSVSCNPDTFARDARILIDGGYRLRWVTPVDQFRWSPHVETVALFER